MLETATSGVLDALTAQVAVLDRDGVITAVNDAWRRFGEDTGAEPADTDWIGTWYLDACRGAQGTWSEEAGDVARGIEDVLEGRRGIFVLEYPCHAADRRRWIVLQVTPLAGGGAVVARYDITDRKLVETERLDLLERERAARQRAAFHADVAIDLERSLDLDVVLSNLAR